MWPTIMLVVSEDEEFKVWTISEARGLVKGMATTQVHIDILSISIYMPYFCFK